MRQKSALEDFATCWEGLEDPRTGNARLHDFHELLTMALCAVLCGAQGAADMALFATSKEAFLRGFLKLEKGVPSHDTFSRLFRLLDPEQFGSAFGRFMASFSEAPPQTWRKVGDQLRPRIRKLAELMDEAEADAIAYLAFP